MKQPIYLPIRDRMVLRHASELLETEAESLLRSFGVDGVILTVNEKAEHDDLRATAKSLRRIARDRTNKEPAK